VYPAFLALIYLVFGHDLTAVRVVQALLSGVTVLILYGLVEELLGRRVARWSAWLTALYPGFVFYSGILLTETLTTFLLVLLAWSLKRAIQSASWATWGGAGIVMGVNVLHRQEMLLLLAAYLGFVLYYCRHELLLRKIAVFLLASALVVGVWTTRNYVTFGRWILVTVHGGDALYLTSRGWDRLHYDDETYRSLVHGLSDVEKNDVLQREGIRNILDDPLRYLLFGVRRSLSFWITSHTGAVAGLSDSLRGYYAQGALGRVALKGLFLGLNTGLILVGVWGMVLCFREGPAKRRWGVFFLIPVAAKATVHFFLFATHRYQVPIMPFVIVFAAVVLDRIGASRKERRRELAPTTAPVRSA
jgi:4-amino-4-deoxy-L-arabinose transferase-like glycosyltransferase